MSSILGMFPASSRATSLSNHVYNAIVLRRGFVEQQIEQLGLLLSRLLGLREKGDVEVALNELRKGSSLLTGMDIDHVAALPEGILLTMLGSGTVRDTLESGKCVVLAMLLCERAEYYRLEGRADSALAAERKALTLLCEALIAEPSLRRAEFRDQIDRLAATLPKPRGGPGVPALHRLFRYREAVGEFARAEDILYSLRDDGTLPGLREVTVTFYRRLLRLSDSELVAGGLPRDEVEEALAEATGEQARA